jgi:hypothetical protein
MPRHRMSVFAAQPSTTFLPAALRHRSCAAVPASADADSATALLLHRWKSAAPWPALPRSARTLCAHSRLHNFWSTLAEGTPSKTLNLCNSARFSGKSGHCQICPTAERQKAADAQDGAHMHCFQGTACRLCLGRGNCPKALRQVELEKSGSGFPEPV